MRWIIPSFGGGQGLTEIVDYVLRVLEPTSAGNKLRLLQILHFIGGSGRDMDVKQLFLPGHASLSEIRLTKICRQTGLINSMVWRFPSPVGFATKTRFSPRVGFLASTPRPRRFSHRVPATRLAPA